MNYPRLSIRGLVLLVSLFCVGLAFASARYAECDRQLRIVEHLEKSGWSHSVARTDVVDSILNTFSVVELRYTGGEDRAVTREEASEIRSLYELERLSVPGMKVDEKLARLIGNMPSLRTVDLSGTDIDDSFLPMFEQASHVTRLRFEDTKVTAGGLMQLSTALPNARVDGWQGGVVSP